MDDAESQYTYKLSQGGTQTPPLALLSVGSCYGAVALSSCAATGDVAPAYLPLLCLAGMAFSMGLQVWSGQTGSKMPLGKGRGPAVLPTVFFFFFSAVVHKKNLSIIAGKKIILILGVNFFS